MRVWRGLAVGVRTGWLGRPVGRDERSASQADGWVGAEGEQVGQAAGYEEREAGGWLDGRDAKSARRFSN